MMERELRCVLFKFIPQGGALVTQVFRYHSDVIDQTPELLIVLALTDPYS